jgi:hypothetical protein
MNPSCRPPRRLAPLAAFLAASLLAAFFAPPSLHADEASAPAYQPPRCEIIPQAGHQVSFRIEGVEKLRWHFGPQYPRPFFFPFNGPAGEPLTRMGHPGAQNHDHHRSVWFAHHDVAGEDFWSDHGGTQIVQTHWYRYRNGDREAIMASQLSWRDPDNRELMQQELVVALRPRQRPDKPLEHEVEFQLTFRPGQGRSSVQLGETNFGFLAVRVAASLSAYFGGGRLSNDAGKTAERNLHERRARWMDDSGPVALGQGPDRQVVTEGITYVDHPDNPSFPTFWHVRDDGWMGAAPGMQTPIEITDDQPLVLRYLLHAHAGPVDREHADEIAQAFAARPGFRVRKAGRDEPHRQYEVERLSD